MILYHPLYPDKWKITQLFGENPADYPTSRGHNGIDWGCPVGTPIFAMQDGKVSVAANLSHAGASSGKIGYGRHVRVQHTSGLSIYGHLSRLDVQAGDQVKACQQIGLSGGAVSDPNSGSSTGPHLHAEFRVPSGAPQIAGGFGYGAIDLIPLLVPHTYLPDASKPLYYITPKYEDISVRAFPDKSGRYIRLLGWGTFPIYRETNGYGLINTQAAEWVSVNKEYSDRSNSYVEALTVLQRLEIIEAWLTKLEKG